MKLDKEQLKAAKYTLDHSIIIAGAGSGKTTTLLKKVKTLVDSGIKESEILVLSFTNETVNNFISKCTYNVDVLTFHKAALLFNHNDYEIADEYVIDSILDKFFTNIPDSLKKKLFHIYKGYFKIYNANKYEKLVSDRSSQSLYNIVKNICKISKTNNIDLHNIQSKRFSLNERIILYCAQIAKDLYESALKSNGYIDFDDIIIRATYNLKNNIFISNYKYILVDEYQDISNIRFEFLKELVKSSNAILTVVGDDWQSIYRFSGSNLSLFYNFQQYFPSAKVFYLNNTYRCPLEIIKKSSKFILKNKIQIKKNLISNNTQKNVIKKVYFTSKRKCLYEIIKKIPADKSVLILSRNNYDIYSYTNNKLEFKNNNIYVDNKIISNIRYMSIHKAKGLEADIVIILNMENSKDGIPSKKTQNIIEKIINIHEPIKNAEERRLFYVAITRCKSKLYLLINYNNPSVFTKEI